MQTKNSVFRTLIAAPLVSIEMLGRGIGIKLTHEILKEETKRYGEGKGNEGRFCPRKHDF